MIRVLAPVGIDAAALWWGRHVAVPPDRVVEMTMEDAKPLISWRLDPRDRKVKAEDPGRHAVVAKGPRSRLPTSSSARRWRRCAIGASPIVGSGMSFHDLRHFRDGDTRASAAFDAWLGETTKSPGPEREARLTQWEKAPSARECHPREEHQLPLMVVAGAAGDSKGTRDFNDKIGGKMIFGV